MPLLSPAAPLAGQACLIIVDWSRDVALWLSMRLRSTVRLSRLTRHMSRPHEDKDDMDGRARRLQLN
jgi:hypothetical protein